MATGYRTPTGDGDSDGGIPDYLDSDDDGDAYEGDEPGECTDEADNDRDTVFDCMDPGCWLADCVDSDGDGIPDEAEGTDDTDGDGVDYLDTDSDGDGIPDADEEWGGPDGGAPRLTSPTRGTSRASVTTAPTMIGTFCLIAAIRLLWCSCLRRRRWRWHRMMRRAMAIPTVTAFQTRGYRRRRRRHR